MKSKTFLSTLFALTTAVSSRGQVAISGYMANPQGTDSPYEYVQLLATANVNFALTPMSLVFANNGAGTANGWVEGGSISYKLDLTSGSVSRGGVFYVGGSGRLINGAGTADISSLNFIRISNTATNGGDGFGNANSAGVIGNGGANADGIGLFNTTSITSGTIPIDAVFFGTSVGTALVGGGAQGYQMPVNDLYSGGKLQSSAVLFPDPAGGAFTQLTGTYDPNSASWSVPRTALLVTNVLTISDISSRLALVPEPSTLAIAGLGLIVLALGRRRV